MLGRYATREKWLLKEELHGYDSRCWDELQDI